MVFNRHTAGLLFAACIVAIGGIVYELVIGTVSSYLLGNSVLQFSFTIGFMLFGMGIGSYVAPKLTNQVETTFVINELLIAGIGGFSPAFLFWIFSIRIPFLPVFLFTVTGLGVLIGLEIPLMYRLLQEKTSGMHAISRIMTLDYVGALIASIAFPLLLLPTFGIVRTALLIGLANACIAGLLLWAFWDRIQIRRFLVVFCGVVLLVLGLGVYFSRSIHQSIDQRLYRDQVVYQEQTPYQYLILTRFKNDIRLYIDGNVQFSSLDEYRYHEPLIHIPLASVRHPERVLVLGGGDGLAARELLKDSRVQHITIVDLDPAMVRLAKTHPFVTALNQGSFEDSRVRVVHDDAFSFLRDATETYDVIVADLPDPNTESLAKLYSVEMYRLVLQRLTREGVFVTQATSPYFSREAFWTIDASIQAAGFVTRPYHVQVPSFGEWGFVLASRQFPVEMDWKLTVSPLRFLNEAVMPSLFVFDADISCPITVTSSTFVSPSILDVYLQDARRWDSRP